MEEKGKRERQKGRGIGREESGEYLVCWHHRSSSRSRFLLVKWGVSYRPIEY